jgi:tetratricopeptide (TPR) repeat protein
MIDTLIEEGLDALEPVGATKEFAQFLVWAGTGELLLDEWDAADRTLRRAIQDASLVGDRHTEALARNMRGVVSSLTGDRGGLADLESSAKTLREAGSPWAAIGLYQVADQRLLWDGPHAAAPLFDEAVSYAHRTRAVANEMWGRGENVWRLADEGAWDELLSEADAVLAWAERHSSAQHELLVAPHKARVLALRGDVSVARGVSDAILERARRTKDPQVLAPTLATAALIEFVTEDWPRVHELLIELGTGAQSCYAPTAEICRMLTAIGDEERARATVDGIRPGPPRLQHSVPSIRGMLAESRGDYRAAVEHYREAAARWRAYGHALELAHALTGTGRCLTRLDKPEQAHAAQSEAKSLFQSLGIPDQIASALTPNTRNQAV